MLSYIVNTNTLELFGSQQRKTSNMLLITTGVCDMMKLKLFIRCFLNLDLNVFSVSTLFNVLHMLFHSLTPNMQMLRDVKLSLSD